MRPTSGLGHWAILWEAAVGSSEPEVCAALRWLLLVQQAHFCPVPRRGGTGQGGRVGIFKLQLGFQMVVDTGCLEEGLGAVSMQ